MLKRITIINYAHALDLNKLTKEGEEEIFNTDKSSLILKDIIVDIINDNHFYFNPYDEEIEEMDEIIKYVSEHLSDKAIDILEYKVN